MSHTRIPSTYLSIPLPQTHRITLHFLLPPVLHLFIYGLEFSCGIALCWSLYHIGRALFSGITAALLFLPALVTAAAILIKGSRDVPLAKRVGYAVFISIMFPVWTVYRLSQRIFWAIEAMLLLRMGKKFSKTNEESGRKWEMDLDEALELSIEPSSAELYLFLRAFLYSLPSLFLHSCIIISGSYDIVKGYETYMVETASIIFSLVYLSMTAAYYQNFESNRLLGRNFPWRGKKKKWALSENVNEIKIDGGGEESEKFGLEGMPSLKEIKEENQQENVQNQTQKVQPEGEQTEKNQAGEKQTIENKSEENLEENHEEKKEVEDNQTEDDITKRNETEGSGGEAGEKEELMTPPSSPASTCSSPPVILRREFNFPGLTMPNERAPPRPRVRSPRVPGGFRDIFCDSDSSVTTPRVSREQSLRSSLFGWTYTWRPNRFSRPKTTTDLNLPHSPVPQGMFPSLPLPERKKDLPKIVAFERDDSIGLSISFCTWTFILIARILTVGNGMYFFSRITVGVCAGHFTLMALWLMYREGRPYLQPRRLLCFAHALTTMSGLLLELGVKPFARKTIFLHSILIFAENLGLGLAWMLPIEYQSWWSSYAFYTALASHLISFACAILYIYALKPQKHILPAKNLLTEAEIIR
ncbi:hypothetical protein J437_LFUL003565 [Ladona fulva]|uniref:XK-related protein n=1 Tax=Ladona fulva TaxID=123851 RepID=A0A8K0JVZ4_LADFU|nr:hypothetical protein J437_LFUL003565 [Ladona fulva]